ncbi:hypothetical protein EDB86DRAFT_2996778 [Lactarius hatsudake]|nr:hypothetical protein EDB86DRAFT_2996778 [Lactarius hatsudake]
MSARWQTPETALGVSGKLRIWWCPIFGFRSLLRAMCPIPSTDGVDVVQYIADLYICSYIPTFTSLIDLRGRSPRPS